MKNKIVISVIFISALLLLLCACGKETNLPFTEPTETPAPSNTVTVTVPEGTNCIQIAELLEEKGVCTGDDFIAAVNDPENLALLDVPFEHDEKRTYLLEGYVFPDTYEFYLNSTGAAALKRFLQNANSKLTAGYAERAAELGYTMDEIIRIASIIQEEAGNPANMPGVSSVIHNRLNSPDYPYLECDVAVKYLENYVHPYFSEQEFDEFRMLYNINGKRRGLPAGPITNPGTDAIEAALYPDETPYFFFVTDAEENYYFAETYAEHCDNCHIAGIKGY